MHNWVSDEMISIWLLLLGCALNPEVRTSIWEGKIDVNQEGKKALKCTQGGWARAQRKTISHFVLLQFIGFRSNCCGFLQEKLAFSIIYLHENLAQEWEKLQKELAAAEGVTVLAAAPYQQGEPAETTRNRAQRFLQTFWERKGQLLLHLQMSCKGRLSSSESCGDVWLSLFLRTTQENLSRKEKKK